MKKLLLYLMTLVLSYCSIGQSPSPKAELESSYKFIGTGRIPYGLYVGTNLVPLNMGEYDLELEYYNAHHLEYHLSMGIADNPRRGTFLKLESDDYYDIIGKGYFLRLGADYNLMAKMNNKSSHSKPIDPFLGGRIIISRITETQYTFSSNPLSSVVIEEDKNSINLGLALTGGTSLHFADRISLKLGVQLGIDIIDNRLYDYGYNPGSGVDWKIVRTQLMGVFRYRLFMGTKLVSMSFDR